MFGVAGINVLKIAGTQVLGENRFKLLAVHRMRDKGLSLRAKTVAAAVAVLVVIIALICAMSELFLLRPFAELEKQNALRNMQRALLALDDRLAFLDVTVKDWAWWDDTYNFVQTRDQSYIQTNLVDSAFATMGINIIVFADRSGEIVFGKAFDHREVGEMPLPQELYEHLKPSSLLLSHYTLESNICGILLLSDNVLLVASRPVLTSEREGPIQGTLVMGSFFDLEALRSLSDRVQVYLGMGRVDRADTLSEFREVLPNMLDGNPMYVTEPSRHSVSAYALLRDIYNRSALVLRADMPGEVYAYARTAVGAFLLYISAAGFVSAVIALFFLDRMVLSRLSALKNAAARIGKDLQVSQRLPVTSNDEISELANTINFMLARIEEGQRALAASEAKYRTILDEMQEGYLELDTAGNITFCNDAACQILGYPDGGLIGTHFKAYVHPDDVASIYESVKQTCEAKRPSDISCRFLRRDGTLGYAEVHLYLKLSEDGGIDGFRVLARDVTRRKFLEQQMIAASRLAITGELAAGMAHELNNPLTGVIGYAQLLMARPDLPADVKSDLSKIHNEGQRAARIVRNLLAFSRQAQPKKRLVDINELVQKTLELRSYELAARGIEVEMKLCPEMPRILVDYNQIQQVVLNIIINAEQALSRLNHHGKIAIETGLKEGYVVIAISDNGAGIPEDISDKVFQPFFTTKGVGEGSGLGLSVCHGIVTAHGGKIHFQSKAGHGTTFFVELPAIDSIVV